MEKRNLLVSIGVFFKYQEGEPFVFLQRRNEEGALKNKLEFPGGKIEKGETPIQALVREVKEEVDVDMEESDAILLKLAQHEYPETKVNLYVYVINKETELKTWYPLSSYYKIREEIPEANHAIFEDLLSFFGQSEKVFSEFSQVLWKS